jgi:adenylate kinase family enzyme
MTCGQTGGKDYNPRVPPPLRICVVGVSGCGKTTLARQLSRKLAIPYINNDELLWLPNWQLRPKPQFAELADQATRQPAWTFDGNLGAKHPDPMVLSRATMIVWLDYPRHVVFGRLVRRTLFRCATREVLFSGNVERFSINFASKDSILLWAWQVYPRFKQRYEDHFARLRGSGVQLVRHQSPLETQRWLASVK